MVACYREAFHREALLGLAAHHQEGREAYLSPFVSEIYTGINDGTYPLEGNLPFLEEGKEAHLEASYLA